MKLLRLSFIFILGIFFTSFTVSAGITEEDEFIINISADFAKARKIVFEDISDVLFRGRCISVITKDFYTMALFADSSFKISEGEGLLLVGYPIISGTWIRSILVSDLRAGAAPFELVDYNSDGDLHGSHQQYMNSQRINLLTVVRENNSNELLVQIRLDDDLSVEGNTYKKGTTLMHCKYDSVIQ